MRVKLHLEQYLGKKKRKVCLLIDEEKFHNVSDLCHMIYQQHFKDDIPPGYSNRHGKVSLYLDGYYIRQSESINIIHHDDVITARYEAYNGEVNEIGSNRKKKVSNQLSNSMLSSSNEVSIKKQKLDNGTETLNTNGQSLKLPEKVKRNIKTSNKKPIKTTPLSKLAIQSKKSSDSSSSSSSDSDSSLSSPSIPSPSSKKDLKPKENKKFPLAQKKGTAINSKKVSETISSSSSSASSSSSSESSSSSSDEEDNNIKNIEQNKKETKSKKLIKPTKTNVVTNKNYTKVKRVDFNVAELPTGSTSTPSLVNNIQKPKNNKRTKDVYKNSSVIIYNDSNKKSVEEVKQQKVVEAVEQPNDKAVEPQNDKAVEQPNVEVVDQPNIEAVELQNVIPLSSLKSNPSLSISNEPKVSSKTLRNRRRRQKRTNLKKAAQESVAPCNEEMENESSVSKIDVVDDSNENKTNEEINNEVNKEKATLENDFSKYEPLKKIPDIGDVIAFKILEMSMSYTPEVSSYKKAMVFDVNERSGDLILELTKDSLTVPKGDGTENRRFEFDEDINDNNTSEEDDHNHHLHIKWSALLEPVLIQKRQDVIVL